MVVCVGELRDWACENAAASESVCECGLIKRAGGGAKTSTVLGVEVGGRRADVYTSVIDWVPIEVRCGRTDGYADSYVGVCERIVGAGADAHASIVLGEF